MPKMTGSRCLAETIKGYGVSHVFFVPAVFWPAIALMDDLGITPVAAHSELAAAYMADGFARASRRPAICFAQAVGATNLAAGLREPYLGCSPVIAMNGGPQAEYRYRRLYQEVEDFAMFDSVTKFNARVEKLERLPDLLRQAFRSATSGKPGPAHLEIPGRLGQSIEAEADLEVIVEDQFCTCPSFRPEAETAQIREAIRLLAQAQRPVIVAGGGVTASGAGPEVLALAEKLSIPVATSLNGKQTIPDNHPLALGVIGSYGRRGANEAVAQADLVFFVGSTVGGHVTDNWRLPSRGTTIIQLDIDPEEIGRNFPARVALAGDACATLCRLLSELGESPVAHAAWAHRARSLVDEWKESVAKQTASDRSPIRPERLCREISDFLPPEAVVVSDTGHSAIWSGNMIDLTKPGQGYFRCSGTLGAGFPLSLGVKCALPDRPVLCLTGDGGMYYHLAELETAARMNIKTVTVVNDNRSLNQTKSGWDAAYGGQVRGHWKDVWTFGNTDFAAIAEAMGCLGLRVDEPSQIRPELERAFAADRPALVDIISDVEAFPPAPWR